MAISAVSLKELIETAKQSESDDAVIRLMEAVGGADTSTLSAEAESFKQLFELWSEEISRSENKAALIVKLAEKSVMDDPDFRTALHYAVRKLLPPYLASGSVVKAIGARDTATGVRRHPAQPSAFAARWRLMDRSIAASCVSTDASATPASVSSTHATPLSLGSSTTSNVCTVG